MPIAFDLERRKRPGDTSGIQTCLTDLLPYWAIFSGCQPIYRIPAKPCG